MNLINVLSFVESLGAIPAGSRAMRERYKEMLAMDLLTKEFGDIYPTPESHILDYYYYARFLDDIDEETTDFDYAMPVSPEKERELLNFGFTSKTLNVIYKDMLSEKVYSLRIPYIGEVYGNVRYHLVEVVTKNNFELYEKVWENINPNFYAQVLWKSGPTYSHFDKYYQYKAISGNFNQLYNLALDALKESRA